MFKRQGRERVFQAEGTVCAKTKQNKNKTTTLSWRKRKELCARDWGLEEKKTKPLHQGVPDWESVVVTLQRQKGPLPKFLDVKTDDTAHWPRGYGKVCDSHNETFR